MKRSKPLRARSLDIEALETINGGKPLPGYTTTNGRGTIHGFYECNQCGSTFVMPLDEMHYFICPVCGGG